MLWCRDAETHWTGRRWKDPLSDCNRMLWYRTVYCPDAISSRMAGIERTGGEGDRNATRPSDSPARQTFATAAPPPRARVGPCQWLHAHPVPSRAVSSQTGAPHQMGDIVYSVLCSLQFGQPARSRPSVAGPTHTTSLSKPEPISIRDEVRNVWLRGRGRRWKLARVVIASQCTLGKVIRSGLGFVACWLLAGVRSQPP